MFVARITMLALAYWQEKSFCSEESRVTSTLLLGYRQWGRHYKTI
jgi:hypothetical protein